MKVVVKSDQKRQVIDITGAINKALPTGEGVATVFIKHTTAALTTMDLDPGTDRDFVNFLAAITPQLKWRHPHNPQHAPDHLLAALIGASVSLPYSHGQLELGQWQRLVLVELDGPRSREVVIR